MPATVRRVVGPARAVEPAAIAPHEVRAHATFIKKYELGGIEGVGGGVPGGPGERDVSAVVFGRADRST